MAKRNWFERGFFAYLAAAGCCAVLAALSPASAQGDVSAVNDRLTYQPDFFAVYQPVTALDMVRRIPGFTLDEGEEVRGYGGAAGNVLIDGKRPSTKTESLAALLNRIPASRVAYIEIIRGAKGVSDAQAYDLVVNVALRGRQEGGDSVSWRFSLDVDGGRVAPNGEASLSEKLGETDILFSLERQDFSWLEEGTEQLISLVQPSEDGFETERGRFASWGGAAGTETALANGDVLSIRGKAADEFFSLNESSRRRLMTGDPAGLFLQSIREDYLSWEVSADYTKNLSERITSKAVILFEQTRTDSVSGLEERFDSGAFSRSLFISDDVNGEAIARLESTWAAGDTHQARFAAEGAYNYVKSRSEFTVDDGAGPVVIDINGANTEVAEYRTELSAFDTWTMSPFLTLDFGAAIEFSRIAQQGDFENERSFTYPKPSIALTYTPSSAAQIRLRAEREIGQLDFFDFVSAANFDDDDIDFGNPELQPERTWIFEAVGEQRFGEIGVVSASVFYNIINDVEDLLPLGDIFEIPGNIGDGAKWGGEIKTTLPLNVIGLDNARLETELYSQRSSVTDPVTGLKRRFSEEAAWCYAVGFRQDFPSAGLSWGWEVSDESSQTAFGLDEVVRASEAVNLSAFVEFSLMSSAKLRIAADNLLNKDETRTRTVFDGARRLENELFVQDRLRQRGRSFVIELGGTF